MAIIQVSIIDSDTRCAKEIRFLGIPVYLIRELDVKTRKVEPARRVCFQSIGDPELQETNN